MHRWVEVDGLEVFGQHYRREPGDFAGFTAVRAGLKGFFDGPSRVVEEQQRQWRDGVVPARSFMGGRVLTVEGVAFGRSWAETLSLGRVLRGVLARGGFAQLTFNDLEKTLTTQVALLGGTRFTADLRSPRQSRFQIQFRAPDPYWVGETRTFSVRAGQSGAVWHYGEVDAVPMVRFVGPVTAGARVQVSARSFVLSTAVASGEVVTVDQASMLAVSSTRGLLMSVVRGVPIVVEPGPEQIARFIGSGSGRVEVVVRDTHV